MKEHREKVEERAEERVALCPDPPQEVVEEVPVRDTDVECPPPPRPKALAFDVRYCYRSFVLYLVLP